MATRTSHPNGPADLIAISSATAAENPDLVLGYVVWYTIPNLDIKFSKLRREWLYAGLEPVRALEADPKTIDAFKRAVASLKGIERNNQAIDPKTGLTITTITETLAPASASFEQWQSAELSRLMAALHLGTGR